MTKQEFIEKWNVAYENLEQQLEFAQEMESDLDAVIEQFIVDAEDIDAEDGWDGKD